MPGDGQSTPEALLLFEKKINYSNDDYESIAAALSLSRPLMLRFRPSAFIAATTCRDEIDDAFAASGFHCLMRCPTLR